MSIQYLYQSRFFRAMAAMMLCLVVLTSCGDSSGLQNTQLTQNSSVSEYDKYLQQAVKRGEITRDEAGALSTFVQSPDAKLFIEYNNVLSLRLYDAVVRQNKAEQLKQAHRDGKEEEVLKILGFVTKDEAVTFLKEMSTAATRLQSAMKPYEKVLESRVKSGCATCGKSQGVQSKTFEAIVDNMKTANIEYLLAAVPDVSKFQYSTATVQGCSWLEPWNSAAYGLAVIVCGTAYATCVAAYAAAGVAAGTWVGTGIGGPAGGAIGGVVGGIGGGIQGVFECQSVYNDCERWANCTFCGRNC
jgi:hypothetical protein